MNGKELKILRIRNDLTQEEVQELTGLNRGKLSSLENDKLKLNELKLTQLKTLSEVYNYDLLKEIVE